jgi:hypothetical protein
MDDPAANTAASSWILLGIVTGVPPYPPNIGPKTQDSVTIQYTGSGTDTASVETTDGAMASLGASGDGLSIEGSYKTTLMESSEGTTAWSYGTLLPLVNTYTDGNETKIKQDVGWMVVLKPAYFRDDYTVTTRDGQPTGITISVIWTGNQDECRPSVDYFEFIISDPTMVPPDPYKRGAQNMYKFPAGLTWPGSANPGGWPTDFQPPASWMLNTFMGQQPFQTVTGSTGAPELLTFSKGFTDSQTNSIAQAIDIQEGVNFSVFKFKASQNFAMKSQLKIVYTNGLQISINYGGFNAPNGPNDYDEITIQPLLYAGNPTIDSPLPWVPTIYRQHAPWLLTWQVNSMTKGTRTP